MKKILFCSHGRLALGMLDTLKVFSLYDEQAMTAITFYVEGEGKRAETEFAEYVAKINADDEVLVFTDIAFGSVHQLVMQHLHDRENVHVISGMNLMIVLSLVGIDWTDANIEEKVLEASHSIAYAKKMSVNITDEDE